MQNAFLIFVHMMAAAVALGSTLFFTVFFLPIYRKNKASDEPPEQSLELKIMDRLASVVMACVFILIISGVYYLLINYTDQVNLKPGYYNIFGLKMIFVVVTLGLNVYQTFGLRSRIIDLDLSLENKKNAPNTLNSMLTLSQANLWVISFAAFFGVFLSRF